MRDPETAVASLLDALRRRTEQAEAYALETESTQISFEAGELKSCSVEETSGVALRGWVQGRLGFTASSGRIDGSELVERVVASARFGEALALRLPGPLPGPEVEIYDPQLAEVPLERLAQIGREIIGELRTVEPAAKIDVDIERTNARSWIRNSAGAAVDQVASALYISAGVERVRGDDVLVVGEGAGEIGLTESYRDMTTRLARRIEAADRAATCPSGTMPVLFTPAGSMVLLLPLLLAVNGEHLQRGTSPLAGRSGEQVLDPRLTLWDDPTLGRRPASAPFDDEGVPCRRKALFQRGIAESFLYDLKTAALMGAESTGNGMRSLYSLPAPAATNVVLEPGETPITSLIASIPHGLLVDSVLGLGQGNPMSGAFSNPVALAYAIEQGEIAGRVKDVTLAGNVYELLTNIAGLSQERQWVWGRYLLPYVLLPEVNVVRSR